MRVNVDLLIFAKWIIPVEPENVVHENYALVIHEGKIVDLMPATEAEHKYEATTTQHLDDHAIIPGLINAHTHAAMSLFKGLADDLPLMDWLNNHIWPAESKWVDSQFVADGSRLAIAEMIRRASVGLIIIDFPTAWANSPQEYFEKGEMVHDTFRNNPLINTSFAPHAPYTVSDNPIKKIAILAEELDIPIHMHIHETEFEVSQSLKDHGVTPLQRLHDLGLLSQRLQGVHMTQLDAESIELITRFNLNIIHCPESNLKLASGFCPVQQLQLAGINVALGTDGSASNNDLNMLGEMRSAALTGKGLTNDPCALSAMTVLKMATINGARAMDISDTCGSITPGKSADIVAIDLNTIESLPVYDPISQIVYASDRNQITDVWVAGKQLLQNRALTTLDINQIKHSAQLWKDKIKPNK
jgi:5-methylthioadenosine/S-adenosylhomocysteine deaminase